MADRIAIDDSSVLLVIDVQNDFCPGGALAVPHGEEVIPVINGIAQTFRHIALTQDWHPKGHISFASSHSGRKPFEKITLDYGAQELWPDHCVQGTCGAAFHDRLELTAAELILRKGFRENIDSYSAFFENDHLTSTGLAGYLRERGLTRVFLAGLAFDFCVRYSAEDAAKCGFAPFVIKDACRAIDVSGSAADTQRSFAALGIACITSDQLA